MLFRSQCFGWRTAVIESCLDRRTFLLNRLIRLPIDESLDLDSESPGCGETLQFLVHQAGTFQLPRKAILESLTQSIQRFRRQLLGADLDQEVFNWHG